MKIMNIHVLVIFVCLLALISCEHLIMGNINNNRQLIHQTKMEYHGIPFKKRVKNMFYSGDSVINSIMAYDNTHSKASAIVTSGGIGYTYVNVRLKSERGKSIKYDIAIYA